ncbi:unnamed protein product [Sphagnum troendelagicum]
MTDVPNQTHIFQGSRVLQRGVLFLQPCSSASAREHRERESALHLEADAASVISCREGKPDFVKPYSTCVAQIVEICEASSQTSQIWSCISASLFCHSHSAAQHKVTSCNHHTNRIPCLNSLEHYGWCVVLQHSAQTPVSEPLSTTI